MPSIAAARRILVLGSSGSGKTHLSGCIAEVLGLDLIHLDAHFWLPGSRARGDREWRGIVSDLAQRESWIMDGTYERSLDLRIPRADAIILLEFAPASCLARVMRRQQDPAPRRDLPAGCFERLDENHLRYVWQYPTLTHPAVIASIARYGRGIPVATLVGPEAVEPFVSQLREAA